MTALAMCLVSYMRNAYAFPLFHFASFFSPSCGSLLADLFKHQITVFGLFLTLLLTVDYVQIQKAV